MFGPNPEKGEDLAGDQLRLKSRIKKEKSLDEKPDLVPNPATGPPMSPP